MGVEAMRIDFGSRVAIVDTGTIDDGFWMVEKGFEDSPLDYHHENFARRRIFVRWETVRLLDNMVQSWRKSRGSESVHHDVV